MSKPALPCTPVRHSPDKNLRGRQERRSRRFERLNVVPPAFGPYAVEQVSPFCRAVVPTSRSMRKGARIASVVLNPKRGRQVTTDETLALCQNVVPPAFGPKSLKHLLLQCERSSASARVAPRRRPRSLRTPDRRSLRCSGCRLVR